MEAYTGTAVTSQERCWRCGTALWRLTPPVQGGWEFYCPACQHLTLTRAAAEQALQRHPRGRDRRGRRLAVPAGGHCGSPLLPPRTSATGHGGARLTPPPAPSCTTPEHAHGLAPRGQASTTEARPPHPVPAGGGSRSHRAGAEGAHDESVRDCAP